MIFLCRCYGMEDIMSWNMRTGVYWVMFSSLECFDREIRDDSGIYGGWRSSGVLRPFSGLKHIYINSIPYNLVGIEPTTSQKLKFTDIWSVVLLFSQRRLDYVFPQSSRCNNLHVYPQTFQPCYISRVLSIYHESIYHQFSTVYKLQKQ
jgi:hypothetical protein